MKIIITENNKTHTIPLPLALLKLLPIFDKDQLSKPMFKAIIRALNAYKKEFGSFVLLEAVESNGQTVKVII